MVVCGGGDVWWCVAACGVWRCVVVAACGGDIGVIQKRLEFFRVALKLSRDKCRNDINCHYFVLYFGWV